MFCMRYTGIYTHFRRFCSSINVHGWSPVIAQLHISCRKEISNEVPTFTKCIFESIVYHRAASSLFFLPLEKGILTYKIGISLISHGFFSASLTLLFISISTQWSIQRWLFFFSFFSEHPELLGSSAFPLKATNLKLTMPLNVSPRNSVNTFSKRANWFCNCLFIAQFFSWILPHFFFFPYFWLLLLPVPCCASAFSFFNTMWKKMRVLAWFHVC